MCCRCRDLLLVDKLNSKFQILGDFSSAHGTQDKSRLIGSLKFQNAVSKHLLIYVHSQICIIGNAVFYGLSVTLDNITLYAVFYY